MPNDTIDGGVSLITQGSKPVPRVLLKHLAAVHNSSSLTIIQRKICNVFLENASKNIAKEEHSISVKDVMEAIGWTESSNVNEGFKDSLRGLTRVQVEWNVLDKDKKNKWVTSTFLTHISIKAGKISYSYSKVLIEAFSKPNVYAQLNLDIQKSLKNKYALILWEFVWGDMSPKKSVQTETDWVTYDQILKLMSLTGSSFENRFALLKKTVLIPALTEINEKSDVMVRLEEKKSGKKTTHLKFICERKDKATVGQEVEGRAAVFEALKNIGMNARAANKVLLAYPDEEILSALAFFTEYSQKHVLDNPIAFFHKALDQGWVSHALSKIKQEETSGVAHDDSDELNEDIRCKNLRRAICEEIGFSVYSSWFGKTVFRIEGTKLIIEAPSNFVQTQLSTNYHHIVQRLLVTPLPRTFESCEFIVASAQQAVA